MNSAVEQSVKDFLGGILSATSTPFGEGDDRITADAITVAGVKVSLHCNVGNDSMPELAPRIVIGVPDLNHVVGPLHKPAVKITVSTPTRVAGITEVTHRAICAAVRGVWQEANVDALDTAMLAAAGASARSWFIEGPKESLGIERWQSELTVNLCLVEN